MHKRLDGDREQGGLRGAPFALAERGRATLRMADLARELACIEGTAPAPRTVKRAC